VLYLAKVMSCLLTILLLESDGVSIVDLLHLMHHPVTQVLLTCGGLGTVIYVGTARSQRIRLPHRKLNEQGEHKHLDSEP